MKNVVSIVLNNFKNDNRVLKENLSLQIYGYSVIVVALHEKSLEEYEVIKNVRVHRVKMISRKWPKYKAIQIIKYLEFVFKVIKQYKDKDIIHCNDLNSLPIGFIIKYFFNDNAKIVYDCHEYETETHGLKGIRKLFLKFMERKLIKYVDETIVVSNSILNEYKKLYRIDKIATVHNTPYYSKYKVSNKFREEFDIKDDVRIYIYQGNLSEGRGIDKYINVFKTLIEYKCCLVLMGYGPMEDEIKKIIKDSKNIYFKKSVPIDEIQSYTSSADYGLNITDNTCLSRYYALPNKLFEYVMARVPVIVSNDYERGSFVRDNKLGLVVEDTSVESIYNTIIKSFDYDKNHFFKNLDKIASKYNWENESKKLIKLYERLEVE